MYASALLAKQGQAYQAVDINSRVGGASPHQLVGLLFDDLLIALRQAALAAEARQFEIKSARITRALSILFALEASLDFSRGGELAGTLSRVYRGAREQVARAGVDNDPATLRAVCEQLTEIAEAWRQIGSATAAAA